jgi:hypothetical protein
MENLVNPNQSETWRIRLLDLIDSESRLHPQIAPQLQALRNRLSGPTAVDPATIIAIITAVLGLVGALSTSGLLPNLPLPANLAPIINGFITQINTLLAAVPPPLGPLPALPLVPVS